MPERKNVLITGGNSGIGLEMARTLAKMGHRVIIASRNEARSDEALVDIAETDTTADVEAMKLDLSDLADVDRFTEALLERMPTIDILILNAGLYTHGARQLPNGLEAMIGVMHFGHFRLVQNLLTAVKLASRGRIVVTSSVAHRFGRTNFKSFTDASQHRVAFLGYAQTKLANLLFTRELARLLKKTTVTVNAFHPGAVNTGIWQELPEGLMKVARHALVTVDEGSDTGVWLATSPEAADFSGEYFVRRKIAWSTRTSKKEALAKELWQKTETEIQRIIGND